MADDDPRPTDPSVLEKGLMAADIGSRVADELRSLKQPPGQQLVPKEKPPATGQMFRGIGSLMRGRISPIVTAAQLFWNEIPESVKDDAGAMVDWLRENKMRDLVGLDKPGTWTGFLDKPGIEYFKQALMPTAQEPKGIMSLPYMLQSGEYASETLGDRVRVRHGTPSPKIEGERFDIGEFSLKEKPTGQGAAMKGSGLYSAQALGVAEDYFDKEPRGRVLLNSKLLPKSHDIPIMTELTNKEVMDPKSARIATEVQREKAEKFAKDFGVDVEDVNILAGILERLEGEKESYGDTDSHLDSLAEVTRRDIMYDTERAREARKFFEGYSSMSDEEFAILHGTHTQTMKDNIGYFRREAEDLERKVEDDTRLLEVLNKYNLKGTPGALVEFAYHPDDWKNMIDLDMKMSYQPEVLEKVLQMPSVKGIKLDRIANMPVQVLRALNSEPPLTPTNLEELTGQQLSETLLKRLKTSKVSERQAKIILAKEFADVGIPGNKYFDQQSRRASLPSEPEEDTRTKNAVVWDQKAMDRATKPVILEGGLPPRSKADGGLVDKPLYDQPRMVG